ncbi:MAG: ATP-binding cassette domain-containing protein, partial [Cyanobacteria bacterium]|nr:ATP-binding cassette domain-containing protein [Cyanobacteriota bacterium]MDW8201665.1 ATP-binding cassette domain-containing protein [Cyanobacteriota bacterium SKYGB_h_bin112]
MLRLHRLTKQYADDRPPALNQVTLTVPTGQVMALIGASGAGKSTLIRCVNRLVQPTSGEVWLDDVEVTRLPPRALRRVRRQMGMIFQNYALVDRLTVMENVLAGQLGYVNAWQSWWRQFPPATITAALQLLEQVGLADLVN